MTATCRRAPLERRGDPERTSPLFVREGSLTPLSAKPHASPRICPISSNAPALCSGSFKFPHLGLCTHDGHPLSQGHSAINRSASPTNRSNSSYPRLVIPTPPGCPS